MTAEAPLEKLQAAYKAWHDTKGASTESWLALMDDSVEIVSMASEAKGLAFAGERKSRQQAVAYFTGLLADWSMVHWTPETFVCEGDRIAVFARCAWTNKRTGKTADIATAHLWTFHNGKAVKVNELFDSARVAAAASA